MLWAEQRTQKGPVNERPVEYGFALHVLSHLGGIEKILDVGSGEKAWPKLLSDCGYKVTAIDRCLVSNRHFRVMRRDITHLWDIRHIPFNQDVITCISTLEHIEQYELAMRNMSYLLRTGGHLILTVPCTNGDYKSDVWRGERPYVTQSFSYYQVRDWAKYYGLRLVEEKRWIVYDGEYWGEGERHSPPLCAYELAEMNLGCFHFVKVGK